MKKFFLVLTISLSAFIASAQNYDAIKNQLILQKYDQAKTDLDKAFSNSKFTSKAEAYILKATIYAGLSMTDANKNTAVGEQLTKDANAAFAKYKEMDPSMSLISDPIYKNAPQDLYSSFFTIAIKHYTDALEAEKKARKATGQEAANYNTEAAQKWSVGMAPIKSAVDYSDLLITNKIITVSMDTNVYVLAGTIAEKSGNNDDAAKYYSKLADNKITGDGYEAIYYFLVRYYFGKKDMASFEKYKKMGGEFYPTQDFFKSDKVDFAVGLVDGFNEKIIALEEVIANDPNSFRANEILGEIIYDTLNSNAAGAVKPSNAAELESKMVIAFNRAGAAKAGYEVPYIYMGHHFYNKAATIGEAKDEHAKVMKAKVKPGVKPAAEDIAKRDMLEKQYGDALEAARDPYEKAAAIFASKPLSQDAKQVMRDKQQYKKVATYLSDIFIYKKLMAKANPKEMAKYEAEEKKWNAVYDSIK